MTGPQTLTLFGDKVKVLLMNWYLIQNENAVDPMTIQPVRCNTSCFLQ